MQETHEQRLRLAAARVDFLDSGEAAGVPDVVAASWRRSKGAGVDHARYQVPYDADFDTDSRLARCARPVLERLTNDMSEVPVSIALADARARIIDRRDCSTAVGRVLDRVDFNPGFSFGETSVGTNGIGTVFEAGLDVSVVGAAHFNEALTPFACTGAPVLDPVSGRLEGVLDVSLLAEAWSPLIHAMVRTAASDIGRNLMQDRSRAQQALFETYVRADARTRHAVVAVGDTVIMNLRAQHLLSPADQLILQQHARHLMAREALTSDTLALPDGRVLHLRITRVRAGADTSGVVLLVTEDLAACTDQGSADWVASRSPDPGLPEHRADALASPARPASRTPAWNTARAGVCSAISDAVPVVLVGEQGSGRRELACEVFLQLFPEGRLLDDREHCADGDGPALLVFADLDRYDAAEADRALQVIDAAHPSVRIAATVSEPVEHGHPAADVLARFGMSVRVPALRHRVEDIPCLTSTTLAELAPGRQVRVSPGAQRVLAAYSWPGNLPQLREILAGVLTRRPVGEIQEEDLPGSCRTASRRTLSPLESAERDAIVAALRDSQGNRKQAATELGMSRSSLYRKLGHYGLHDL